jgi:hypothetical protein
MKTKLIFCTEKKELEKWTDFPFVPRLNEWINVVDIVQKEEIAEIYQTAECWSTPRGTVMSVEYRRLENEYYAEVRIWCED